MFKNVASQKTAVFAYDTTTGDPKTGDAANITAQISKDGAATAATNDVNPTELDATDAKGIYLFDNTQAETNGDLIVLSAVSATANIRMEPVIIYTQTVILPKKNTALNDIEFLMVDTTDNVTPKTGLTVTGTRSIDGGAFGAVTGTIAEVGNGIYQFDASAADMNGTIITFRFAGAGANDSFLTIKTGG